MNIKAEIFLVESHLQVNSVIKTIDQIVNEGDREIRVFVRYNDNAVNNMLLSKSIMELNGVVDIVEFRAPKSNKFILFAKVLLLVVRNYYFLLRCKRLYIGDYRSKWMRLFKSICFHSDVFYLDDGMATVYFYHKLKHGVIKLSAREAIITSFSLGEVENIKVTRLKSSKENKRTNPKVAYIIGMPVLNLGYVCAGVYKKYLSLVRDVALVQGVEVIYYLPHRNESVELISDFLTENAIYLKSLDVPVEKHIENEVVIPLYYFTLYSTAAVNLEMNYSGLVIFSYVIRQGDVSDEFYESLIPIYEYFKANNNFSII